MYVSLSKALLVSSTLLGILGATAATGNAASFLFDFESGLPAESLSLRTLPEGIVPFTPTVEIIDGNGVLRLSDELPGSQGGSITSSFVNPTATFENVKVSALLNPAGDTNDRLILFARVNVETFDAYLAGVDFATNEFFLDKVVAGEVSDSPLAAAFDVLPALDRPYVAELTVIDNRLTGRLFDETGTHLLAELSAVDTDNPFSSGVTAVSADISDSFPALNDPNNATVDNFAAMSVPEPTSILGLLAVGALAAKVSRSRVIGNRHW